MKFSKRNALLQLAVVIAAMSVFGCASRQNAETKPLDNNTAKQQAAAPQQNTTAPPTSDARQNPAAEPNAPAKEPEMEISLPESAAQAAVGSNVTIPITVSSKSDKEIFSYSFAVMFDPEVLKPTTEATSVGGTMSDGFMIASDTKTPGRLGIAAASASKTIKANGTLLNTHFKVIGKSSGKMNLKIAQPNFQDNSGKQINVTATIKQ